MPPSYAMLSRARLALQCACPTSNPSQAAETEWTIQLGDAAVEGQSAGGPIGGVVAFVDVVLPPEFAPYDRLRLTRSPWMVTRTANDVDVLGGDMDGEAAGSGGGPCVTLYVHCWDRQRYTIQHVLQLDDATPVKRVWRFDVSTKLDVGTKHRLILFWCMR